MPRAEQDRILATDEIYGFLEQKNISAKNIARLETMAIADPDGNEQFQTLRLLVLDIARAHPRRKRRWKMLRENHADLYQRAVDFELILSNPYEYEMNEEDAALHWTRDEAQDNMPEHDWF